jgi:DNA repair exonuclease SbcCD ATPase subunit
MNWFLENWQAIVGTGTFTTIINYLINKQLQKQQLRAGNIDNEIKEAEQGLKEVELLKETITVYKDVNADLKSDLSEAKEIIKEFKIKDKRYEELEKKVDDLVLKLALETEKSQFLIKENTDLKDKYDKLEKDHEDLKLFCEKLKKELDSHKRTTR